MKKCAAIIIGIILLNGRGGYTQQNIDSVLSLKQCVDIALTNNLLVKQNELQTQTDYINLKQARDNRIPQLIANINHGTNQGRSIDPFTNSYANQNITYGNYDLAAGVNLFNGGQIKNSVRRYKFGLEASQMDLQQIKENTTLNIILAYLQILNNEDLVEQSKDQFTLTQKQVDRLEILNKEGSIIPAQLYELKGQLANDELALVDNENALDAARLTLCQLMNIPYKKIRVERIALKDDGIFNQSNAAEIYQFSLQQFPAIKAAALRTKSQQSAIKFARGALYPAITLGGDLFTNFSSAASQDIFQNSAEVPSGDFIDLNGTKVPVITNKSNFTSGKIGYFNQFSNNYSTSLNVNLRIPILNYRQAKNRVALAQAEFKNAVFLEQSAKTQLSQNIEQAHFNMTAAYKKLTTLQQQVSDFNEAYKIAEVRFNEGATNQVEYLIAKNNVDRANINLIIARYDYIFRTKILDYYQGKLVL
ncbi:MAG: TolC family protein [Ginsengibacter sp.]